MVTTPSEGLWGSPLAVDLTLHPPRLAAAECGDDAADVTHPTSAIAPIAAGEGPLGKYVATLDTVERARTEVAVRDAYEAGRPSEVLCERLVGLPGYRFLTRRPAQLLADAGA